jgi:hypothetical protein
MKKLIKIVKHLDQPLEISVVDMPVSVNYVVSTIAFDYVVDDFINSEDAIKLLRIQAIHELEEAIKALKELNYDSGTR